MRTYDAVTIGSSTVDVFANTEGDEFIEIQTSDGDEELIAYPLGSKVPLTDVRHDVGGNGVNVAVGLSRLGHDTAYVGKIGTDPNGTIIKDRLEQENVSFIGGYGEDSGMGIILDSHIQDERTILTYKGCNNTLAVDDVDQAHADLWYCTSMLDQGYDTMQTLVKQASDDGATIAFNPSMTIADKGRDHLQPVLDVTDILLVNEEEASAIANNDDLHDNIDELNSSIPTVVVTQGSDGVTARHDNTTYTAPSQACDVVETTGAGDAFSSGFLAGALHDKSITECIRLGMLNAENVLCHYGAHNDLLTWDEAQQQLQADDRAIRTV